MARKQNMPVPDKIKNAPVLNMGLLFFWKAYQDLTSDRDVGMGVGPIPWLSMSEWGSRHRVRGDDFERLVYILRAMDATFMEHSGKKSKSKMGKGKGSFNKAKAMRTK